MVGASARNVAFRGSGLLLLDLDRSGLRTERHILEDVDVLADGDTRLAFGDCLPPAELRLVDDLVSLDFARHLRPHDIELGNGLADVRLLDDHLDRHRRELPDLLEGARELVDFLAESLNPTRTRNGSSAVLTIQVEPR